MSVKWIKVLFVIAGISDLFVGAAFFFASNQIFHLTGAVPPNHPCFVQFPSALIAIFGALFLHIAADPLAHRDLIPYVTCFKISVWALVFAYQLTIGIAALFVPLAWIDVVYTILFLLAWRSLATATKGA